MKETLLRLGKTAIKWFTIFVFLTLWIFLILYGARKLIFVPENPVPQIKYDSGQSGTTYDPGELNELIEEIDNVLTDLNTTGSRSNK